jgi:hypothetical protein
MSTVMRRRIIYLGLGSCWYVFSRNHQDNINFPMCFSRNRQNNVITLTVYVITVKKIENVREFHISRNVGMVGWW